MKSYLEHPKPISKPRKTVVPLAIGLSWNHDPNIIYQEKMDGQFSTLRIMEDHFTICNLAGEQMPDGAFYAFDILQHLGMDIRRCPLGQRHMIFNTIMLHSELPPHVRRVQSAADGGKFLADLLARGGEGVVRKSLDAPWGIPMEACKRLETFQCIVTGRGEGQSVDISMATGEPCGRVSLFGGKADRVRVGSIIKVEGFGLTAASKIREPRPCKDTPDSWLIKY